MKRIKWGVLGTAAIAAGCTIPGMKQATGCELYAIAGRDEKKVEDYKARFGFKKAYVGYEALLQDPEVEAVYIPLPNHLHFEWVMKAIEAGKHVLCEKPLAMNAEDAKAMYAAAKEKGVILSEAYAYLHSPYIKALKDEIASGSIGDVVYIKTAFVTQGYKENIRLYKEQGGGAMYDLGCYCTTMIRTLTGVGAASVKAVADMNEYGADINTAVILTLENGIRASFQVGMLLGQDTDDRYDRLYVYGTKGYIKSDVEYNQAGELSYTVVSEGKEEKKTVTAPQNYCLEVEQMNRAINGLEPQFITPEFSIANAELIDKVLEAMGY